jgi:NAD(P)-dependent dehydrogenase (short-subunit alcohol dehydrogenase family)
MVVTGASAGIGHEAALELAKLGADVTVVATQRRPRPRRRSTRWWRAGAARSPERRRARRPGQARRGAGHGRRLAAAHPRLDVLLNNAGCYPGRG